MKKHQIYAVVAVTIIITILTLVVGGYFIKQNQSPPAYTSNTPIGYKSGESDIYKKYVALEGAEYDKAFISDMIVQHKSAVDMAELAKKGTSNIKILDIAKNITANQGKTINDLASLQQQLSYPTTSGHSTSGNGGMTTTESELKNLTANHFDKKFLELMIENYKNTIDIATPAAKNALHQDVKNIAKAIIGTQSKELEDMQKWQLEWGYSF